MVWKKLSLILGIVVALISVGAAAFEVDKRFAKAEQVQQIGWRLDHKIIKDRIEALQERIWNLEDRYSDKMTPEVLKEIRKLKHEKELLNKELDKLIERIQR